MTSRNDATPRRSATPRHDTKKARVSVSQHPSRKPTRRGGRRQPVRVFGLVFTLSVVVVLAIAGVVGYRQGFFDGLGIGMTAIPVDLSVEGYDKKATPIPIHIEGTRDSGVTYTKDAFLTTPDESLALPQGTYELSFPASPILSDGNIFSPPRDVVTVSITGDAATIHGGDNTSKIAVSYDHLDLLEATDADVNSAKTYAQSSVQALKGIVPFGGKSTARAVEANIQALQQAKEQAVLPDSIPDVLVMSTSSGTWSTRVTILPDGTFTGVYTDTNTEATGTDYPKGTAHTCSFSGRFTHIKQRDEYTFTMSVSDISTEHTTGEKWVKDGTLYIGADPYGFETGSEFELYLPGKPAENLSWNFLNWCVDYAMNGYPTTLDRVALCNTTAAYGFFSETPSSTS